MGESIKKRLKKGKTVVGSFVKFNSPAIVEMLGYTGFDFLIIDGEHSSFSFSEIENLARAANGVGCDAVVRIPSCAVEHVLHAADIGVQGVQIPSVKTIEQAERAVMELRYYPDGNRGFSLAQRAANYTFLKKEDYFKSSAEDLLSVVHVENLEMASKVEELCKISQIDVLFIGPGDLSQAIGHPGELNHPEVVTLVENITRKALANGKIVGVYCGSKEDIEKYMRLGIKYLAFSSDMAIIASKLKEISHEIMSLR